MLIRLLSITCLLMLTTGQLIAAEHIATPDGTPLQQLIDQAAPGDTLHLQPGLYAGGVLINKPLTLRGDADAIIDAEGEGDVIRVEATDVRIYGLTLRNSGFNLTQMNAAVHGTRGAHRLHVEDTIMEENAFGLWVWHAEDIHFIRNRVRGNTRYATQDRGDGIRVFNVTNGLFSHNTVWDTRDGMYVDTSRNLEFSHNTFHDVRYGIHYMFAHNGRILNNYTTRTRSGNALMMSRDLVVDGNVSVNDHNYGILLNFITYSTITNNRVHGVSGWDGPAVQEHGVSMGNEGKAVFIFNSLYNTISGNTFADSEIGIHLTAGSERNEIYNNAFIRNQFQVKYVASRKAEWSHEGRGNFWSDYLGWDLDADGIGDQPYEPNDGIDKLLWKYPMAKMLMNSPAIQTLRWVQSQFPILRSPGVQDSFPLMRPPQEDNT
jgi:nitrous oxidase accessory protein